MESNTETTVLGFEGFRVSGIRVRGVGVSGVGFGV